jgi:hypothetical protein
MVEIMGHPFIEHLTKGDRAQFAMGSLPGKVLRLDLGEELKVVAPVLHEQF